MYNPIYNTLKNISEDMYPFHMPGHKRNKEFLKDFYAFINLDFTEIEETDNMHKPESIIKKSMEIMASTFGSDYSYFLVNGSSCGIIATLMSHLKENDNVLVARNCHISVYNGIMLSGANPIYVHPTLCNNIPCGIEIDSIKKAILENPNIKAFILTSPTYEGFVSNIEDISILLHKHNILLIVDEAHGAHFKFSSLFPKPAIDCGADIVIQSFHKTLPSFTQCAALHIKGKLVNKNMLEKCLSIVQTTSPSYMFMLSLEYATNFVKNNKQKFEDYSLFLKEVRKDFLKLEKIKLIDEDFFKDTNIIDFDISRFTFLINSNINGDFINKTLKENKIQLEMYGENHIIAISTICDTREALEKLRDIILKIDNEIVFKKMPKNIIKNNNITKSKISLKDAFYKEKIVVDLSLAKNKISSDFITPYPPGIPLVAAGEIITEEIVAKIDFLAKNNINILGINDGKISIIK